MDCRNKFHVSYRINSISRLLRWRFKLLSAYGECAQWWCKKHRSFSVVSVGVLFYWSSSPWASKIVERILCGRMKMLAVRSVGVLFYWAPSPWTLKNVNRLLRLSLVLLSNEDLKFYSNVLALKICTKSIEGLFGKKNSKICSYEHLILGHL